MTTKTNATYKTWQQVMANIEAMMKDNPRKRVFHATAERGGTVVVSGPESDSLPYGGNWQGVRGIQRNAWNTVPGYATRVCRFLAGILADKDEPLN